MVQPETTDMSVRHGLIAMLLRLKRFACVLAGTRQDGTALLGRAARRMLDEQHRYQRGTPLDRWAFAEIYRLWLEELRQKPRPMQQDHVAAGLSAGLFRVKHDGAPDDLTATFLETQPAQQRCALLLIHGEGFDYEDAARVLDCSEEAAASRLIRASAAFADRLMRGRHSPPAATVATLFPEGPANP
jgi:DNA-directed RNA polymerase specialized sigma24 family protein